MGACTVIEGLGASSRLPSFSGRANPSQTAARNATATLCNEPVRDRSIVAPIATAVTGSLATAFVSLRLYESYVRKEWQWADLCAVVALVSYPF